MTRETFNELLESNAPVIIDGGLATQCEAMGADISGARWSAKLLLSDPELLVRAHRAYLDAGARIIATASYQASREGLREVGLSDEDADAVILQSVELAVRARQEFMDENPKAPWPLIAASIGPYGAAQHDGSEYTGAYDADAAALRAFHESRLQLMDASEADLLACETFPSVLEAEVMAALLRKVRKPTWISFCCRDGHHLSDGTPIEQAAALFRDHPRVAAVGVNCTAPRFVASLIDDIRRAAPDQAIIVYPNSGEAYDVADGTWRGSAEPGAWISGARSWYDAGARIIGGCCRVGPEDISALRQSLARRG